MADKIPVRSVMGLVANSVIDSRHSLMQQINGGEQRDLDRELGYPKDIKIEDYKQQFSRGGIGSRVVKIEPDESWIVTPLIAENQEDTNTEFEEVWSEFEEKFQPFYYLHRGDILSGIGRFGILLIGIDDGKKLRQPVKGLDEMGEAENNDFNVTYLRVFDESVVSVSQVEERQESPRYGLPVMYEIDFSDSNNKDDTKKVSVHWHRIIHIADNRMQSEVYGVPRMKPVYNRLLDIKKILGGSGEMFWRGAFPGYSFEANPELLLKGGEVDVDGLKEELFKFSEGLQRYIALSGVSAKSLTPQTADPTKHMDAQLKAVALTLGIPHRILMGSEEAKVAGEADDKHWRGRMRRRENIYITPKIIRPFINRLIAFGSLPKPEKYKVEWPPLREMTEKEVSELAMQKAEALRKYVDANAEFVIPKSLFLKFIMQLPEPQLRAIEKATQGLTRPDDEDVELVEEIE